MAMTKRLMIISLAIAAITAGNAGPAAHGSPAIPLGRSAPAADAREAAATWVGRRPAAVRAGSDDVFVQGRPLTSQGWQYVPYQRTYRGLPVVGGDFVVIIDPAGNVQSASVAQQQAIENLDTGPPDTGSAAERVTASLRALGGTVAGSRLVIYARGSTPRLAWEATILNADGAPALTVDVDASTGAVLDRRERVLYGTGASPRNGPGPLYIHTTYVHFDGFPLTMYVMRNPHTPGMSCGDHDSKTVFTQTVDTWGSGLATDRKTGCVDALFAAQTATRMLSQWLGRDGLDGTGGGWPIWVGLDAENAHWNGGDVTLGHDRDGNLLTSLDLVGHELGHGIDQTTPGGVSRAGTKEFIADALGAATEWFANQPAGYDTPDFLMFDGLNINKRVMYAPALNFDGSSGCYGLNTATAETHVAAGPGDHWFYLLAEGTHPTDGQPDSNTCNGTSITGIGVRAATQILYHAMLMKTSTSSYEKYRTWTLTAARNLFQTDCTVFKRVKAAWDAVNVPAQPADPICGPNVAVVPNLIALSLDQANQAITAAGLVRGSVSNVVDCTNLGAVDSQDPRAGATAAAGSAVNITVGVTPAPPRGCP